jgi:hypothetical protein
MARKLDQDLDYALVGLEPDKVTVRSAHSGVIGLPKGVLVGFQPSSAPEHEKPP